MLGAQRREVGKAGPAYRLDIAISDSYNNAMKVSVADAKNRLPELIKAAEDGESITICRRGKPVVDLVRTAEPRAELPKFGTLKDKVVIRDAGWWKPMTEAEVDRLLEERR